jgi:hypothetical protein
MDINARFRQNVRTFYAWIGAVVVLGVAPLVATRLIEQGSPLARAAAVVVGVAGTLPWLAVAIAVTWRGDEFTRRLHLIAAGCAFAGSLVLLSLVDWLVRAGFLDPPDYIVLWLAFLILWLVALFAARRHYERVP